jgi:hypothetical protein
MTVETTARKQSFAGGQATLTFTFKCLPDHPEDIKVVAVSSGTETVLTYGVDYTVDLASDGVGGTVTLTPSFSTLYTHTVYRETANKQESDYEDFNQFPADTLEEDLDRRTLVEQEMQEDLDRSVKLPISSTASDLALPEPVAGKALKWNATADALVNTDVDIEDAIAEAAAYASTASTQAGNAAASAAAASASEGNAAMSEANALGSEITAATSATTALNAASTASTASISAATSATTALNAASTASTQAIAAATSATTALNAASTASTQAALAGNYASTASTQAALAGNYASTASTQATNAANSASTASSAAVTAQTAATDALGTVTWNMLLADHAISGLRVPLTANATIAFGDICAINTAGTLKIAKADAIANASALVLAGSAAAAGTSSTCLVNGLARDDSWNWTPGQLLYLSATGTTGNTITSTAPTGSDQVIQIIGVALTADIIYFIPSLVMVEHT